MKGAQLTVRFGLLCGLAMSAVAAATPSYIRDWRGNERLLPTGTAKPVPTLGLPAPSPRKLSTQPGQVEAPTLSPASNDFAGEMYVSMSTSTPGAVIYYEVGGRTPTLASPKYSGPITITRTTILRAKAFKDGMTPSNVAAGVYLRWEKTDGVWVPTKDVMFTYSRHPKASPKSLQSLFNSGAKLLEKDDDGPGDRGKNDDVSLKVYFTVTPAADATFPDQSGSFYPAGERYDYTQDIYNEIPNDVVLLQLLTATFAHVKQATSCAGGTIGATVTTNRNSMVLTQTATGQAAVHEWGHLCGLDDTYLASDSNRIMYGYQVGTANEINFDELIAMLAYVSL